MLLRREFFAVVVIHWLWSLFVPNRLWWSQNISLKLWSQGYLAWDLHPTPISRVCVGFLCCIMLSSTDRPLFTPAPKCCLLSSLSHSFPWYLVGSLSALFFIYIFMVRLANFLFHIYLRLNFTRHKIGIFMKIALNLHSNLGRMCILTVISLPRESTLYLPIHTGLFYVFSTMFITSLNANFVFQIFFWIVWVFHR